MNLVPERFDTVWSLLKDCRTTNVSDTRQVIGSAALGFAAVGLLMICKLATKPASVQGLWQCLQQQAQLGQTSGC